MKNILISIAACGLTLLGGAGAVFAQDEEADSEPVFPIDIYACSFNDGKGPADLDKWVDKWNAWVDSSSSPEPYSAWTLTPFYYGSNQDFDFVWLGASPTATDLGRAYDRFLSSSGSLNAEFAAMASCSAHGNFATMRFKEPPSDDFSSFVLSFSDCNHAEGKTFDDIFPAMQAWSEYRTGHGSEAGMWVMWPAYGGGDADFDFKVAVSHPNYASQGADYDQYSTEGYKKANELFAGLVDCDEARSYNAVQRRDGIPDDE
jgi:hypothetical protein